MVEQRRWRVSGQVQGVFFRASTRREAESLALAGHALNLANGEVEVLACGEPAALDRLEMWLQSGPPKARVDRVEQLEIVEGTKPGPGFRTG